MQLQLRPQKSKWIGSIAGSLVLSLVGIPLVAAQAQPKSNCTCPAASKIPAKTEQSQASPRVGAQPPLPEQQQAPSSRVVVAPGRKLDVKLVNKTYDPITYEVIGDTQVRTLPRQSILTLRNLRTPSTITFQRPNGGLVQLTPRSMPGQLEVTLDTTTDLGLDINALTIEPSGLVFLN